MSQLEVTRHRDVYPEIHSSSYSREEFEGKVVIVTGGGNCLGRAAGMAFAELGSSVAFADNIRDDAESAAKEAHEKFGVKSIAVTMDVTKLEDNERLVETVERELGPVDCVVFSAVKARWDTIDLSTSEDWWSVMETNLKGPVDLTRLLVPGMLKRNTGTFIYHASRGGTMDLAWTASYAVSKAALIRFAGSMQADYKDTNLRFYSTHTGSVRSKISIVENVTTPLVREKMPEIPKFIDTVLADFLDATAELSAWTCCYLFSKKAIPLRGNFIDCNHDVGMILKNIEEVEKSKLYTLKVDRFEECILGEKRKRVFEDQ